MASRRTARVASLALLVVPAAALARSERWRASTTEDSSAAAFVQALLDRHEDAAAASGGGASVDVRDHNGATALMHAAMHGHRGIVDTLLLHGADARLKRADGQTAVGLAAAYGRPASLGALFRADPSLLEARDGAGRTAFHWAAASRHETTLKYLLGRWWVNGALAAVDGEGDTPLHLCRGPPRLLFSVYLLKPGCGPADGAAGVAESRCVPIYNDELEQRLAALAEAAKEARGLLAKLEALKA